MRQHGAMSRPLQLEFLSATVDVNALPESRAEVAFLGRSNVGKSSLLNALANQRQLAHVSNMPGRTQVLACFALDRSTATLLDCPGYGYAKVPKATRETWVPMIEQYLLEREALRMALLLVDSEIGPTPSDLHMLQWLRENGVQHTVIGTKQDKVKPSKRLARQKELAERCGLTEANVVWVSTTAAVGIDRLRELVSEWLGVR